MLNLKQLEIERAVYGPQKGLHIGKVIFDGDAGEVSLKLTPDLCHRLLLICAEGLIATAKEAATALVCEAQASVAKDATAALASGA